MKEHEAVRELLALAAAGALDADEMRRVAEHTGSCDECARQLEAWRALAGQLAVQRTPMAPAGLVERTQARVLVELAGAADRRWNDALLALLAVFTWTVGLTTWIAFRLLTGGALAVFQAGILQTLWWLTLSTLLAWLTAGIAAVLLGHQRHVVRRHS